MSIYSKKKDFKDLSLLDEFLFALATENPQNAELIARTIIRRVFGWQIVLMFKSRKCSSGRLYAYMILNPTPMKKNILKSVADIIYP